MRRLKFLHCADLHLDAPFSSLGSQADKIAARRQDLRACFRRIVDLARDEAVDLLLVAGDLYEHDYTSKSTIAYVNDSLGELSGIRVFLLPGNHDPLMGNSFYTSFPWHSNIFVLTPDRPRVWVEDPGVTVSTWEASRVSPEKSGFHIILAHGTVDMDFGRNVWNPLNSSELLNAGADYIALGHFHNRLEDMGDGGVIYNPGSPEPLGFDEEGDHGVFLGCLEQDEEGKKNLEVRFVPTAGRYYSNRTVNVEGCTSEESMYEKVQAALPEQDSFRGLFSLTLKGYVDCGLHVNPAAMEERLRDKAFFIRLRDETVPDYDLAEFLEEPGIRGLFARRMQEKLDRARDERERKMLQKALYLGLEALEKGRVEGL